ncbi:zinc ribbon domain-containing protein [Solitalea lacus]|uniref:zinc ribbon domain-containing protein n=1 Tax=Solitalea lacus TaxID=2911172 RepID=UPI001EDBF27C|nr:C4-type zinc ribbon domain-containing protein [Solitalea lacus]UKJ07422.1 C4-type zinc ribbon domain-containing protein [Solitalea lacus]
MEATVEQKLQALWDLQTIHSKIDKIRTLRGELPMEVNDLEDEVAGLETRINKLKHELDDLEDTIVNRKNNIKESQALIKKYEGQQNNVKNNREFEALSKEVELQSLDIQVNEKRIREHQAEIQNKKVALDNASIVLDERNKDLSLKREELQSITGETQKEEDVLLDKASQQETKIEDRLLTAYKKLRSNAKNGLAVVTISRDSCSGCFNKIPPQRQADIRQRKKIIVCEHCGRIIVDEGFTLEEVTI